MNVKAILAAKKLGFMVASLVIFEIHSVPSASPAPNLRQTA